MVCHLFGAKPLLKTMAATDADLLLDAFKGRYLRKICIKIQKYTFKKNVFEKY